MTGSYLMGASPELVFRTEGRAFKTHPLAGSAPRIAEPGSAGDEGDSRPTVRLEEGSRRARLRHQRHCGRLAPIAEELNVPQVPRCSRPPAVAPGDPIDGVLKGLTCLDGARAIHPTPDLRCPTERLWS